MNFNEQAFGQRFGAMGDEAEAKYEEIQPHGNAIPFGWRRPSVTMQNMTDKIRYMPDFYAGSGQLVEVMGCNGPTLRGMKVDKWEAMKAWNKDQPVEFFLWNRKKSQWLVVGFHAMTQVVAKARRAGTQVFESDGNEYYPIQWEWLEDAQT